MEQERFEILRTLGKGRTGGVYEAVDSLTNQRVALRRLYSVTGDTDPTQWQESFVALAHHLEQFKHPALLAIHASGVDEDGAFMAMELLEGGRTIEEIVEKNGHLSDENFYVMANNLLDAFSVLHYQGVCHGSVSGRSIMEVPFPTGGKVYKCVDLGMSSLIPLINPSMPMLTGGDPALTAPELFEGAQPDARSDVYMLGHLFYMSLAGGHPLAGIPADEAHRKHKGHKFAPLSGYRSSVPQKIVDWIELMTAADPNARPQSAGEALELMPVLDFTQKPANALTATAPLSPELQRVGSAKTLGAAYGVKNTTVPGYTKKKSSAGLIVLAVAIVIMGAGVLFFVVAQKAQQVGQQDTTDLTGQQNAEGGRGVEGEGNDKDGNQEVAGKPDEGPVAELSERPLASLVELKTPKGADLINMKRVSYEVPYQLSETILEDRELCPRVSFEDAKGVWFIGNKGKGKVIGEVEITRKVIGDSAVNQFVPVSQTGMLIEHEQGEIVQGRGLLFDAEHGQLPEKMRYSVRHFGEGDIKARLFVSVANLKVKAGVAISGKLRGNRSMHELGPLEGTYAIDIEIKDVKGDEYLAFEYNLVELVSPDQVGKFVPIAFALYADEFPPIPEGKSDSKETAEPEPQKPTVTDTKEKKEPDSGVEADSEFKNGVKITPDPSGKNRIDLAPLPK